MPYQIKNGIIYSGNAVTLTQAQYDALTTAEKNNGTVYYIYDSDAMIEAQEVGLDGGNVEDLAGSVATFETSPSTAVHAEGEYILYQAQLYKVTSAIAVGEDLTVGSNIEATNLGNELNNGLTNIEMGTLTNESSQISSVEFARYVKWGRVCVANLNFTVGSAISSSKAVLFSGLPPAARYKRFIAMQVQSKNGVYARIEVDSNGYINNAYTPGSISTGQYEGIVAYITAE